MNKAIGYLRNIVGYNNTSGVGKILKQALQWLTTAASPNTAVDKTSNGLDAGYVENNATDWDGVTRGTDEKIYQTRYYF